MPNTEVISAFLDDEEFDPRQLAAVLATSEGRDTLLQLVALRQFVQPVATESLTGQRGHRGAPRLWVQAAVLFLAIGAGFGAGALARSKAQGQNLDFSTPPQPTVVVHQTPDGGWQPITKGD